MICNVYFACSGAWGCVSCDCDVNEWGSVNYDFYQGGDWSDGASLKAGLSTNPPDEKTTGGRWVGAVPEEPVAVRRARTQNVVADQVRRGQEEGKDFRVSSDGLHIYSVCN